MEQLLVSEFKGVAFIHGSNLFEFYLHLSSKFILAPGRTLKFPGYIVGVAGLFLGLGEILGTTFTYTYIMHTLLTLLY